MLVNLIGDLQRVEELRIKFNLNKQHTDRHHDSIHTIINCMSGRGVPVMQDGDELKLSYQFSVLYFGRIVEALTAVCKLLNDPDVVADVQLHELQQGESLIVSVIDKLRECQAIIARRNGL